MHWTVSEKESGTKLLAFLKDKLGDTYSARHIKRAIENQLCQVNGRVERFASTLVGTGDRIRLDLEKEIPNEKGNRILFEDNELLFYNKPAGLPSDSKELPKKELVHRLDKDTTGVLIFAKNDEMRDKMFQLFKEHRIEKSYLAIVDGIPTQSKGKIENFLGKLHEYQGQAIWGEVKQEGLYAQTDWEVEGKGKQAALIRCYPKTGRTHQIRVHMNGMGHPILGDYQYGRKFRSPYRPARYLLHAESVSFKHPTTGQLLNVSAPLPDDFKKALSELKIN